jgi:hypothetical protein
MSSTVTRGRAASGEAPPTAPVPPREPNGGAAAAVLATGIGCAAFGACVVAAAASEQLARLMTISEPVGPLSGKALVAVVAWLVSWAALHVALRRRDVSLVIAFRLTFTLVGVGLVETFPPVYERFLH